ncbi:MAG: hypothetical protein R3D27_01080 [Hyphomicrobiaceae bacterium]
MLGRLILLLVQVAVGWTLAPVAARYLPPLGQLRIFVYALIFAVIVWVVGIIGSLVLKDVAKPSPAALTFAIVGALIGAGLTLVPQVTTAVAGVLKGGIPVLVWPLAGAVLGYALKR